MWIFPWINSPDITALCETKLDDSIDSGNFSMRGYLLLIQKDSIIYMHGPSVYVKKGLPFAWDLSLENSADSYLHFPLALLHSMSYFLSLYWSLSSYLHTVFDPISSNTDSNFSSKVVWKIIVMGEAKKYYLPRQCLGNLFANVIWQISLFASVTPWTVFGNVVLFI